VVLLLAWSWTELVWTQGDRPRVIALILILYFVAQLLGMAIYGSEVWLARAELFSVHARTFARFAPLEFYVRGFEGSCRALRCRSEDPSGSAVPLAGWTHHVTSVACAFAPTARAFASSPAWAPAAARSWSPC
jgi:hypothetical protein